MTQKENALNGKITPFMRLCAQQEGVDPTIMLEAIACGKAVIPANRNHQALQQPAVIGKPFLIKINANIGTAKGYESVTDEMEKLELCQSLKVDTVMDLSIAGPLSKIRKQMLDKSLIPLGSVPIYSISAKALEEGKKVIDIQESDFIDIILEQAKNGIDFMTLHAGITKEVLRKTRHSDRFLKMVSRGGSIVAGWMSANQKENPFLNHFDEILDIAREYDVTLSLGDGLRPGSVLDSSDSPQFSELIELSQLAQKAHKAGVQVMIEGPGHIPLDEISMNIKLQQAICKDIPFFVLGPLVTDIAPGYDHIVSAIGASLAGFYGADFICYLTPNEHLGLPDKEAVKQGIIASKIAVQAAHIARKHPIALKKERTMAIARKTQNWEMQTNGAIDPERVRQILRKRPSDDQNVCSMCGPFCAIKTAEEYLE